jgi:alcohol dehydrogenase
VQAIMGGLGPNGTLMLIGGMPTTHRQTRRDVDDIDRRERLVFRHVDSEDTMGFCERNSITSLNEIYPFEGVQAAYNRMMSGKAPFRVVLTMAE